MCRDISGVLFIVLSPEECLWYFSQLSCRFLSPPQQSIRAFWVFSCVTGIKPTKQSHVYQRLYHLDATEPTELFSCLEWDRRRIQFFIPRLSLTALLLHPPHSTSVTQPHFPSCCGEEGSAREWVCLREYGCDSVCVCLSVYVLTWVKWSCLQIPEFSFSFKLAYLCDHNVHSHVGSEVNLQRQCPHYICSHTSCFQTME